MKTRGSGRENSQQALVEPLLLTVDQAALMLSIGRTTMYDLIGSGTIASVHIGKCRRVTLEALEQYIAGLSSRRRK